MRTLLKPLFYGSLLVVPLLAASLWLDTHGEAVTGTVALVVASRIAMPLVALTGIIWLMAGMLFLCPARPPRVPSGVEATARVAGSSRAPSSSSSPRWSRCCSIGSGLCAPRP